MSASDQVPSARFGRPPGPIRTAPAGSNPGAFPDGGGVIAATGRAAGAAAEPRKPNGARIAAPSAIAETFGVS